MKVDFPEAPARTSVAVVGAGAVGGVVAWALRRAGHEVCLCVRVAVTLVPARGGRIRLRRRTSGETYSAKNS
nr:hypothetical protein StreXyl84_74660 [Streptomyces sp. Xyl84]